MHGSGAGQVPLFRLPVLHFNTAAKRGVCRSASGRTGKSCRPRSGRPKLPPDQPKPPPGRIAAEDHQESGPLRYHRQHLARPGLDHGASTCPAAGLKRPSPADGSARKLGRCFIEQTSMFYRTANRRWLHHCSLGNGSVILSFDGPIKLMTASTYQFRTAACWRVVWQVRPTSGTLGC